MASIGKTLCIGSLLYVTPKILGYLCTRPQPSAVPTALDRLRTKMALYQEEARKTLGEKRWDAGREIFVENAWISFLALSYLAKCPRPLNTFSFSEQIEMNARGFVLFCGLAWMARTAASKLCSISRGIS